MKPTCEPTGATAVKVSLYPSRQEQLSKEARLAYAFLPNFSRKNRAGKELV